MNLSSTRTAVARAARLRRTLLLPLVASAFVVTAGCARTEPPPPAPGIRSYQAIVLDVSGSVVQTGALVGYGARAAQVIEDAPDQTLVAVIIADGSALTSLCIPRTVKLQGDGPNRTQRDDDLAADRQDALAILDEQLRCGREKATPGSDLIGGLMVADREAPAAGVPTKVSVFSDGMQASQDLRLSRKLLLDDHAIATTLERVKAAGLVPSHLAGGSLLISDPGTGARLTAAQAVGVEKFWSSYAAAAAMTLDH